MSATVKRRTFITLAALCLINLSACWFSLSSIDDIHENISLEEAGRLVEFPICLPTLIPVDIDEIPRINYFADFGDSTEKDIVIQYFEGEKSVLEIWERYTPGANYLANQDIQEKETAWKYMLMAWLDPNISLSEDLIDSVDITSSFHASDGVDWTLYEIVSPVLYQSTSSEWIHNEIRYRIYSLLSGKELVSVINSMFDCERE